jgi:hypothetical protein
MQRHPSAKATRNANRLVVDPRNRSSPAPSWCTPCESLDIHDQRSGTADLRDRKAIDDMVDELQKVTRLMEESEANQQGTCVPE